MGGEGDEGEEEWLGAAVEVVGGSWLGRRRGLRCRRRCRRSSSKTIGTAAEKAVAEAAENEALAEAAEDEAENETENEAEKEAENESEKRQQQYQKRSMELMMARGFLVFGFNICSDMPRLGALDGLARLRFTLRMRSASRLSGYNGFWKVLGPFARSSWKSV